MDYFFAHENFRKGQKEFSDKVFNIIKQKKQLFVEAPTGSGKTASVLSPALSYAVKNNLKVVFLTSRHTQHEIAIKTAEKLNEKLTRKIIIADIIGKKNMCALPLISKSNDFFNICKTLRENEKCEYYNNTRKDKGLSLKAKNFLKLLYQKNVNSSKKIKELSEKEFLCPYEIAMKKVEDADLIIADYNQIFNPKIRKIFLSKLKKDVSELIIIADEAHNLPERIRNTINSRLSKFILQRAIKEAEEYYNKNNDYKEVVESLKKIELNLQRFSQAFEEEDIIERISLLNVIKNSLIDIEDIDDFKYKLEVIAEETRLEEKPSFLSSITNFLEEWNNEEESFLRMIIKKQDDYAFVIKALDASIISKKIINESYSFIAVSATLKPSEMFAKILGAEDYEILKVKSPFEEKNRLDIIITNTTTKYNERGQETYKKYAENIQEAIKNIPGNIIIFFPSYNLIEKITYYIENTHGKKVLFEKKSLTSEEKKALLEQFKENSNNGSVLFAVVSGSFGEGVDLPGDYLKAVIVVGLPFEQPDLETKKLIEYYDKKFFQGWNYGYLYPAFNKIFQNAGRLIRTENDRGVVLYIDYRYAWEKYKNILDEEHKTIICSTEKNNQNYFGKVIKQFYEKK